MAYISTVEVDPLPPDRFTEVLGRPAAEQLLEALGNAATVFQGRVIWNVNSTAIRGGLARRLGFPGPIRACCRRLRVLTPGFRLGRVGRGKDPHDPAGDRRVLAEERRVGPSYGERDPGRCGSDRAG